MKDIHPAISFGLSMVAMLLAGVAIGHWRGYERGRDDARLRAFTQGALAGHAEGYRRGLRHSTLEVNCGHGGVRLRWDEPDWAKAVGRGDW